MKPQLAIVFERIFRPYQCAVRHRQPIDEARQEKTHGRATCKHGKRFSFGFGKRSHLSVGVEQRSPFGDVVGMIDLEAPGVEADRNVVGERIGTGKIEIDQAGQLVAKEEDVIGKKIGMDDALRQLARPRFFQSVELHFNFAQSPCRTLSPRALACS